MPTPVEREREDWMALADNGGVDGWVLLDRLIAGAPEHLRLALLEGRRAR